MTPHLFEYPLSWRFCLWKRRDFHIYTSRYCFLSFDHTVDDLSYSTWTSPSYPWCLLTLPCSNINSLLKYRKKNEGNNNFVWRTFAHVVDWNVIIIVFILLLLSCSSFFSFSFPSFSHDGNELVKWLLLLLWMTPEWYWSWEDS